MLPLYEKLWRGSRPHQVGRGYSLAQWYTLFWILWILDKIPFFKPPQAAQSQAPAERRQRELRNVGLLPPLAGPPGREQVPDGVEEPVRPGHRGPLPAALRQQGLLHSSVWTHHPAQAHLQGGGEPRRRLLTPHPLAPPRPCPQRTTADPFGSMSSQEGAAMGWKMLLHPRCNAHSFSGTRTRLFWVSYHQSSRSGAWPTDLLLHMKKKKVKLLLDPFLRTVKILCTSFPSLRFSLVPFWGN